MCYTMFNRLLHGRKQDNKASNLFLGCLDNRVGLGEVEVVVTP